jgi:hypothetical protein
VPIHTENGHILKVAQRGAGVALVVECDEGVCETIEMPLSREKFLLVMYEGLKALNESGDL